MDTLVKNDKDGVLRFKCTIPIDFDFNGRPQVTFVPCTRPSPLIALQTMPFYACFPRYGRCYEVRIGNPFGKNEQVAWHPAQLIASCTGRLGHSYEMTDIWTSLWTQMEPILSTYRTNHQHDPIPVDTEFPRFGNLVKIEMSTGESLYLYRYHDREMTNFTENKSRLFNWFEAGHLNINIVASVTMENMIFMISTQNMQSLTDADYKAFTPSEHTNHDDVDNPSMPNQIQEKVDEQSSSSSLHVLQYRNTYGLDLDPDSENDIEALNFQKQIEMHVHDTFQIPNATIARELGELDIAYAHHPRRPVPILNPPVVFVHNEDNFETDLIDNSLSSSSSSSSDGYHVEPIRSYDHDSVIVGYTVGYYDTGVIDIVMAENAFS